MTNKKKQTAKDYFPKATLNWHNRLLDNLQLNPSEIASIIFESFSIDSDDEEVLDSRSELDEQAKPDFSGDTSEALLTNQFNAVYEIVSADNIRALANPSEPIRFAPFITVFYGRNSSGKSTITQLLKTFSASRQPDTPPGFASEDKDASKFNDQRSCSVVALQLPDFRQNPSGNNTDPHTLNWESDGGADGLLDSAVIDRNAITSKEAQAPWNGDFALGMDAFERARDSLKLLSGRINARMTRLKKSAAKSLGDNEEAQFDSAMVVLGKKTFTKEEVDILEKKESDLLAYISEAKKAKKNEEKIKSQKASLLRQLHAVGVLAKDNYQPSRMVDLLRERQDIVKQQTSGLEDLISKHGLDIVNKEEWQSFVVSAEAFITEEFHGRDYPSEDEVCIFCRQQLSTAAIKLISSVRERLSRKYAQRKVEIDKLLKSAEAALRELEGYEGIPRLLEEDVLNEDIVQLLGADFPEITRLLKSDEQKLDELIASAADPEKSKSLLSSKESNLSEVRKDLFAARNSSVIRTWHEQKQAISMLDGILREVSSHNTNWGTKRTDATNNLAITEFKSKFIDECKELGLPFSLEVRAGTDKVSKQAIRKTTALGQNPTEILSESERSVWVLADVLAELETTNSDAVLVLDDPVTSMDVERISRLARRIIKEADSRQVIILTHNRHFFIKLRKLIQLTFKGSKERVKGYVVERWQDQTGIVGEINLFKDDKQILLTKVQGILDKPVAEAHEVAAGFLILRRLLENCIDQDILKGFRTKLDPEMEKIEWKRLKAIDVDSELVDSIRRLHGRISDYGDLHLTATATLAQPTRQDLHDTFPEVVEVLDIASGIEGEDDAPAPPQEQDKESEVPEASVPEAKEAIT